MRINRHWHKVEENRQIEDKDYRLIAWGGSLASKDEAARNARGRLKEVVNRLMEMVPSWSYDYQNSEIREPIIEESDANSDNPAWVITRNRYGALILNVADVAFIDIDYKPKGCLLPFLNETKEKLLNRIYSILERSDIDAQVYETFAGYRLLVTNKRILPNSYDGIQLLEQFKADKLYATLCRKHECYRARLTPKPFRIGVKQPNVTVTNYKDSAVERWVAQYTRESSAYAVCKLTRPSQSRPSHPTIAEIMKIHDTYCLASDKPLA